MKKNALEAEVKQRIQDIPLWLEIFEEDPRIFLLNSEKIPATQTFNRYGRFLLNLY